jgi:cell wall-associated NlpC family hydrolase
MLKRPGLAVLLAAAVLAGCAAPPRPSVLGGPSAPATPSPPDEAADAARPHPASRAPTPAGRAVVATADALLGRPYRYGGAGPEGFDCSGLVQVVFARHGIALPRTCAEQAAWGQPIARDALRAGDLVFFGESGDHPSHVGIYEGDGRFIHASAGRGEVRRDALSDPWFRRRWSTARRLMDDPLP